MIDFNLTKQDILRQLKWRTIQTQAQMRIVETTHHYYRRDQSML